MGFNSGFKGLITDKHNGMTTFKMLPLGLT